MEPVSIILAAFFGGLIAAAVWNVLTDFLCRVIETILPNRYGRELSRFVRKVIGLVRKVIDLYENVQLIAQVLESWGSVSTVDYQYVSWSEVPDSVRNEIRCNGEYRYEKAL